MIDVSIEPPSAAASKFAAAYLVQTELKFRAMNQFEMTLLPFNLKDYMEAVEYGKLTAERYKRAEVEGQGRGDSFQRVADFVLDSPVKIDKNNREEMANKVAEMAGIAYSTANTYLGKALKLQRQGEL